MIDNQDKAYLLGLFYSDGSVSVKKPQCRIQLKIEDKSLIFHLQELFPFFHIYYDKNEKIILGVQNKNLKTDLINNGCYERKSFENRFKLSMPNINSNLIRHFIRGYYDGDGGCTLSTSGKKVQKRVYIYSASKAFLLEIKEILEYNNINCSFSETTHNRMISMYKLSISTMSYELFYNYLYSDSNLYMQRKKDLFDEILNTNLFVPILTPKCIYCNSDNVVGNGVYKYKNTKKTTLFM